MYNLLLSLLVGLVCGVAIGLIAGWVAQARWRAIWNMIKAHYAIAIGLASGVLIFVTLYMGLAFSDFWSALWANAVSSLITGAVVAVSLGWYVSLRVARYQQTMQDQADLRDATYEVAAFKRQLKSLFEKDGTAFYPPARLEPLFVAAIVGASLESRLERWESKLAAQKPFFDSLRALGEAHNHFVRVAGACYAALETCIKRADGRERKRKAEEYRLQNPTKPYDSASMALHTLLPADTDPTGLIEGSYLLARALHPNSPDVWKKPLGLGITLTDVVYLFTEYGRDRPAQEQVKQLEEALERVTVASDVVRAEVEP